MKLTLRLTSGEKINVADFDQESAIGIAKKLADPEGVIVLQLEGDLRPDINPGQQGLRLARGPERTAYIPVRHVTGVYLEYAD